MGTDFSSREVQASGDMHSVSWAHPTIPQVAASIHEFVTKDQPCLNEKMAALQLKFSVELSDDPPDLDAE